MTMFREGRKRPTFDSVATFIRNFDGIGAQRGRGRNLHAYMLKRTPTEVPPAVPSTPPPTSGRAAPATTSDNWVSFWPTPDASDDTYQMPDPPDIDPTILPDDDNPFLWHVRGRVGSDTTWELPQLNAIRVYCDEKDLAGRQVVLDLTRMNTQETSLFIPQASIAWLMDDGAAAFANDFRCRLNRGGDRRITRVLETQDHRYFRVIVEDRGEEN